MSAFRGSGDGGNFSFFRMPAPGLSQILERTAFTELSIGKATATAWIMTAILLFLALVLIRTLRRQGSAA